MDSCCFDVTNVDSGLLSQRYIADLGRAWPVLVVCGGIAPLVLSVAYLILVRYFVGILTWLTIILLNALTLLVTLFFYIKGITFQSLESLLTFFLIKSCDS